MYERLNCVRPDTVFLCKELLNQEMHQGTSVVSYTVHLINNRPMFQDMFYSRCKKPTAAIYQYILFVVERPYTKMCAITPKGLHVEKDLVLYTKPNSLLSARLIHFSIAYKWSRAFYKHKSICYETEVYAKSCVHLTYTEQLAGHSS